MNEALVPALPPPQAISAQSEAAHNLDTDLQTTTLARTSLTQSNSQTNHEMLAFPSGAQAAATGGQGKPGEEVGEGGGQAQELVSIKELKHGLDVANTRLIDMERHVRMLSDRIVQNPSLIASSALTAASMLTTPLAGPDVLRSASGGEPTKQGQEGEASGAGSARETELQQRIAHLERLLLAQCEAQHSHLLPAQRPSLAQDSIASPHPVTATAVPRDVAQPPLHPVHPAPSLPLSLSEEGGGLNAVTSPGGEGQRARNQCESTDRVTGDLHREGKRANSGASDAAVVRARHAPDTHVRCVCKRAAKRLILLLRRSITNCASLAH